MKTEGDAAGRWSGILIDPLLPLSLLEAVKAHDRPREILEDEDLSISLPRRLGLTGVVESQIHRLEEARRRRRRVPLEEAISLLRLVLRRPDAEAIMRETGHRVARRVFERTPRPLTALLRILPARASAAAAARAATRAVRRFAYPADVTASRKPFTIAATGAPLATVDADGAACALYTGIIEETAFQYTGRRPAVLHSSCTIRGAPRCEWQLPE